MYAPCPSLLSRRPLALALALCITTPALAQQQPDGAAVQLDAVNVRGERADAATTLSGFGTTSLLDAPASIAVIERQQLLDRQARVLSEVLRADASAGDAYAPIGYYENFVLRGYSLNAANSYRINGLSAVGEQSIALENKQQVQILKGLAGLQSGVNEPAGLIDYRTKRPEHVRSVTLGTDEQGSRYIAADLGDWFDADRTLGVRVNAAREDFRSYVDHADGYRNFLSLAGDWKPSAQSLLQVDVEYQHRQQRSVPGYQLLGGTQVPRNIDVHRLLGYQPWSRPVEMDSLNAQLRYAYQFNEAWRASVEAAAQPLNHQRFLRVCLGLLWRGQLRGHCHAEFFQCAGRIRRLRLPQPGRHPRARPAARQPGRPRDYRRAGPSAEHRCRLVAPDHRPLRVGQ